MMLAVDLNNITKQYAGNVLPAVNNLSFQIQEGAAFGLLGPNGAGKSTLIMMLCGLLRPDAGQIAVFGMNIASQSTLVRKAIGVVPQEIALFPTLTAYENLFYFGKMYGLKADDIHEQIKKHLNIFALEEKENKQVGTFSGGMKRRLNLIAALLHKPKLLVLDEPTAGVDVQSRTMILEFLQNLNAEGTTLIYSSHILEEAERVCSHIAIMDEGTLILSEKFPALMQQHTDCVSLEQLFLKLTGKNIRD